MSITWKIEQLQCLPQAEGQTFVVNSVHWRATAVDGDYSAGTYGTVGFERGDTFTAYDSLTEAQVIAWVKDKLDAAEIEASLQSQIEAKKNPVTATGTPWQ